MKRSFAGRVATERGTSAVAYRDHLAMVSIRRSLALACYSTNDFEEEQE
jgi:hypothetical protein